MTKEKAFGQLALPRFCGGRKRVKGEGAKRQAKLNGENICLKLK